MVVVVVVVVVIVTVLVIVTKISLADALVECTSDSTRERTEAVKRLLLSDCEEACGVVWCVGVDGGRYFFSTVREGDQIMFATDDEAERTLWVQAVYRATGQSHKPVPPSNQPQSRQAPSQANTQLSKVQGGMCHLCARPADNTWLGSRVVSVLDASFF